jgi:hypothetical protein
MKEAGLGEDKVVVAVALGEALLALQLALLDRLGGRVALVRPGDEVGVAQLGVGVEEASVFGVGEVVPFGCDVPKDTSARAESGRCTSPSGPTADTLWSTAVHSPLSFSSWFKLMRRYSL